MAFRTVVGIDKGLVSLIHLQKKNLQDKGLHLWMIHMLEVPLLLSQKIRDILQHDQMQ